MADKRTRKLRKPPAALPYRWGPDTKEIPSPAEKNRIPAYPPEPEVPYAWQIVLSLPHHPSSATRETRGPFQEQILALPESWVTSIEALISTWAGGNASRFWEVAADRFFGRDTHTFLAEIPTLPEVLPGPLYRYTMPFPLRWLPELHGESGRAPSLTLRRFSYAILFSPSFWPDHSPEALRVLFARTSHHD